MPRQKATPSQIHQAADPLVVGSSSREEVPFTLRVRHPNGTDRLSVRPSQTLGDVRRMVAHIARIEPASRALLFSDMGCTEPLVDDDEELGPLGLALANGDMLTMKEKPKAPARKKKEEEDVGADGDAAASNKRQKPAGKSGGEYLREGKTPRDIAIAFMTPEQRLSGEAAYSQMAAAARLDALAAQKIELTTTTSKAGKKSLIAQFTSNRRPYEERGPCYSLDELVGIMAEIVGRQTTSSRRTASSASHLINAEQIARRSPAMFWSIYALGDNGSSFDERLQHVLGLANVQLNV